MGVLVAVGVPVTVVVPCAVIVAAVAVVVVVRVVVLPGSGMNFSGLALGLSLAIDISPLGLTLTV